MKTKSEAIKALKDEAINLEIAAGDAAIRAKQLRKKIEDLEKKPEPVRCKEWWIRRSRDNVLYCGESRDDLLRACNPSPHDAVRVIEPLQKGELKTILIRGNPHINPKTIALILDDLEELGMVADD